MRARHLVPLAVAAAVLVAPAAAEAASGAAVQSGWWNEAAVGPVSTPSASSSNQLQVSNGFSGPLAFAAVRVSLPAGTDPTDTLTLRLAVTSGSTVGTPAVSACPTTSSWKPGPDQPASAAPGYSCRSGRQADGQQATGMETWSFPVSWGSGGTVSVALVPTPGTTSPFSISYAAPTSASVTFAPAAGGAAPPAPSMAAAPAAAAGSSGDGSTATSPAASGQPVDGSGASPGAAAVTATGSPTASGGSGQAPTLGPIPGAATGSGTAAGVAVPAGGAGGASGGNGTAGAAVAAPAFAAPGGGTSVALHVGGGRGGRVMAFCLLVATGLALWFVSAQPDRAPRLLGSLGLRRGAPAGPGGVTASPMAAPAPPVVRGIGRFARERTAPPKGI